MRIGFKMKVLWEARDREWEPAERRLAGRQNGAGNVKIFSQIWPSTVVLKGVNGGARETY
jgi:hypothetical protein